MTVDKEKDANEKAAIAAQAKLEADAAAAKLPPVAEDVGLNVTRKVVDEDKDGKADPAGARATVNVFEVLIERSNNEKIATEVFEFELPILQKLHGENAVRFDEDSPAFEAQIDGDANSVLKMLEGKYNSPVTGNVVAAVYRDADEFASKSGIAKAKKSKGRVESENTDNRKSKK